MCRFVLYVGPPIVMADLVTRPENSLVNQSHRARLRKDPLNGDGFGVSWFASGDPTPALYRSLRPAWGDRNLVEIARVTTSTTILAHVRAASPGLEVAEINCHPFTSRSAALVHNGAIGDFAKRRRELMAELSDQAFAEVRGTTDSELLFSMWQDEMELLEPETTGGARLAAALARVVARLNAPDAAEDSYLNVAVTDGASAAVSRWATRADAAPSLFTRRFESLACVDGVCQFGGGKGPVGVIVASEPFDDADNWIEVPPQSMVVIEAGGREVSFQPCGA